MNINKVCEYPDTIFFVGLTDANGHRHVHFEVHPKDNLSEVENLKDINKRIFLKHYSQEYPPGNPSKLNVNYHWDWGGMDSGSKHLSYALLRNYLEKRFRLFPVQFSTKQDTIKFCVEHYERFLRETISKMHSDDWSMTEDDLYCIVKQYLIDDLYIKLLDIEAEIKDLRKH